MTRPILVTGAGGQVGRALAKSRGERTVHFSARTEVDFDHPSAVKSFLHDLSPRAIINTAAYTAVDKAETERDAAFHANRDGPELLADYARTAAIPLLHLSTDYVFDGTKGAPYLETDLPNPTGIYGVSKLAGEAAVLAAGGQAIILRTAWVYAPWGRNFLRTMLEVGARNPEMRVVADQIGCPTFAPDLATAIWTILEQIETLGWRDAFGGVFHAAGSGETSWHGFAEAIFEESARWGGPAPRLAAIRTEDWPTPAKRPADSRLDCSKLARTFGVALPPWREAVTRAVGSASTP